ncbi:MAG: hypothetical protein KF718_33550 [Polyangiaceae bacterium]|nr:hypothetical protein [Polyangiaceae bacterium]
MFAVIHTSIWVGLSVWVLPQPATTVVRLVTGALLLAMTVAAAYTGLVVVREDREKSRQIHLQDLLEVGPIALLLLVGVGMASSGVPRLLACVLGALFIATIFSVAKRVATSTPPASVQQQFVPPRLWVLATALRSLDGQERTGVGCLAGAAGILGLVATVLQLVSIAGAWIVVELLLPAVAFVANVPRRALGGLVAGGARASVGPFVFAAVQTSASTVPAGLLWVAWAVTAA